MELEIIEKQTEIILADLQTEQIDCGILAGPLGQVGISEDFLFDESFFLYIASMHHLAKLKYISEANLSTDELWLLEEGHCLRNQVFQLCKHRSKKVAKLPVNFRGGNLESLKSLVQQGFGYTLVPQLAITPADDDLDTIEIRAFREPVPSRRIVLAHRRHQLKVEFFAALSKSIQKSLPRKIREASLQKTKILNPISGDS